MTRRLTPTESHSDSQYWLSVHTKDLYNTYTTSAQRLRRWANIV